MRYEGGEGDPRAHVFFERGRKAAYDGHYEYAIEMFLAGLSIDPDNLSAHRELRTISLKRKAGGGKDLGMFKKLALKRQTTDETQQMLNAEQLLCYHPADTDAMVQLANAANAAGFEQTADWALRLLKMVSGTKLK